VPNSLPSPSAAAPRSTVEPVRLAAVLGSPITHSLSPALHTAAYATLGLSGWSYTRVECDEAALPGFVAGLGPEWAGLSLTMPLKEAGLRLAAEASPTASAAGAANTLVRRPDGAWRADNTDVAGMVRVLREAGLSSGTPGITVLGGGGTARAALVAAHELGAEAVTLVARRPAALDELAPVAAVLGLRLVGHGWADAAGAFDADAVISTVPKGAADHLAGAVVWRPGTVLFDAIYDPWPTPLAAGALAHGNPVVSGLDLLLAQALSQFEQFTGVRPAPEAAMCAALSAAAGQR
jgi:shikimate dehydrogenase